MSRAEWVLGIILILLLVVVAVLSLLLWFGGDNAAPVAATAAAPLPQTGLTAATATAAAEETARAWQADAQILRATATWPQSGDLNGLAQGLETWNLTFYSAAANALAEIIILEGEAHLVSETPAVAEMIPAEAGSWLVDSSEASRIMLSNGGAEFARRQTSVTQIMNFDAESTDGRAEWFVSLFANESGESFTMRIDATSGAVLETTP